MAFNNIEEFIAYLENHYMPDPGHYDDFVDCVAELGNPQLKLQCFHVGGTNGKGSTTNYLRSMLEEAGYKVGIYTSPHLEKYNDRIRINNIPIPDDRLLEYANTLRQHYEKHQCSMVEIMTLISFYYFLDEKVDYAIYEVGKGGRFDSTNVIMPLVTAITNIEFDHTDVFGPLLSDIAYHKTGIIKKDVPLVTTERKVEARKLLEEACLKAEASFHYVEQLLYHVHDTYLSFQWQNSEYILNTLALYQLDNASLALACLDCLKDKLPVSEAAKHNGLAKASWGGRFEVVATKPLIILDGAHNEHGTRKLVESSVNLNRPLIIIYSAIEGKGHSTSLKMLAEVADQIIITEFDYSRRLLAEEVAAGFDFPIYKDFAEALDYAKTLVNGGTILITGSLYLISEVRKYFKND